MSKETSPKCLCLTRDFNSGPLSCEKCANHYTTKLLIKMFIHSCLQQASLFEHQFMRRKNRDRAGLHVTIAGMMNIVVKLSHYSWMVHLHLQFFLWRVIPDLAPTSPQASCFLMSHNCQMRECKTFVLSYVLLSTFPSCSRKLNHQAWNFSLVCTLGWDEPPTSKEYKAKKHIALAHTHSATLLTGLVSPWWQIWPLSPPLATPFITALSLLWPHP